MGDMGGEALRDIHFGHGPVVPIVQMLPGIGPVVFITKGYGSIVPAVPQQFYLNGTGRGAAVIQRPNLFNCKAGVIVILVVASAASVVFKDSGDGLAL